MVRKSASAWQGCRWSESPLMTGTEPVAARSIRIWCENVRAMIPSTIPDRVRATSPTDSLRPREISPPWMAMACPPSCVMPASKLTRVLRRLLEDHGECLARERVRVPRGVLLDARGQLEDLPDLLGRQVMD